MRPRGLAASWPHGIRETLNKSPSAEQRLFSPIRAVPKAGNTQSIPPLSELSASEKSLAVSSRGFTQSFPREDGSRRMWRDTAPGIRAGENPANMAGMVSAGSIPAPAGCSIGHPPFCTERARPHQPMAWRRTPLPGSRVPGGWKNGTAPGWGCSGRV